MNYLWTIIGRDGGVAHGIVNTWDLAVKALFDHFDASDPDISYSIVTIPPEKPET